MENAKVEKNKSNNVSKDSKKTLSKKARKIAIAILLTRDEDLDNMKLPLNK